MFRKLLTVFLFSLSCLPATAEGNLTRRAERLVPLLLDAAQGFSVNTYDIETGVYYRWRIISDGREDYSLFAPDLFRESWIDQVVIADIAIQSHGLHAISFGDAGEVDVWFIALRPGRYPFFVEGLETQGFQGEFVVK